MKILQYCSVCKTEFEMEVVPTADGDDDGVVWLQCPSCKGFLPKIRSSLDLPPDGSPAAEEAGSDQPGPQPAEPAEEAGEAGPAVGGDLDLPADLEAPPAGDADASETEPAADEQRPPADEEPAPPEDLDRDSALVYRPWNSFEVGDVVKHLAWDDYGVVLAKETLPGNRRIVKVNFENAGVVRLIEQDGSRS